MRAALKALIQIKIVVLAIALCGCASEGWLGQRTPEKNCLSFSQFIRADPVLKARNDYKSKEFKFLALSSIGIIIPGITFEGNTKGDFALNKLGYMLIPGTSDGRESDACNNFNTDAYEYAERSNEEILRLVELDAR